MDRVNSCQGELLDISILSLSVKEVVAKIIDNVIGTIVVVLNQNHANSVFDNSEIKSIVMMVIKLTQ